MVWALSLSPWIWNHAGFCYWAGWPRAVCICITPPKCFSRTSLTRQKKPHKMLISSVITEAYLPKVKDVSLFCPQQLNLPQ